ncbi:MAG TPA: hypothetical protein DET40_22235 [Lentisphaeria bacterium]|nr:MAG: hypothetical protein A2X45_04320 [Lentisphaerae bacterium GWF2_50_93]HCE46274.1 hypothetical protein [Lentisphaeria bacterium]
MELNQKKWPDYLRIGKNCIQRRAYSGELSTPVGEYDMHKAGFSELRGDYDISRSAYFCHVIFFTVGGAGILETPSGSVPMREGSLMIVPAGCPARYHIAGKTWRILWFDIMDTERWSFIRTLKPCVRTYGGEFKYIDFTMRSLHRELQGRALRSGEMAATLAEQLVIYLERELKFGKSSKDDEMLEKLNILFRKVENRLQFGWTVAKLANEANVSSSHFHLLCRKYLKRNPLSYVTWLRMQRASELLLQTRASVSDISYSVGYGSPLNFSTAFRRSMKMCPREFREVNRG